MLAAVVGFHCLLPMNLDTALAAEGDYRGWTAYVLNVRAEQSADSALLGVLNVGTEVNGIDEGEWVRFEYNGRTAYVKKEYLSNDEILKEENLNSNSAVSESEYETFRTLENLNIRSLPTTESSILGLLPKGETAIGRVVGGWIEIEYNGNPAYLSKDFVERNDATQAYSAKENESYTGWTTDYLRVRRLPSVDSEILSVLDRGTKVTGILRKDWVEFEFNGERAFVHKNYLSDTNTTENGVNSGISEGVQGMINLAKSKIGSPYVFASSGPSGFDCSGFTSYLYREIMGIELPRNSEAQWNSGYERVSLDNLQAGDILYYPGHVAFYIGGGKYIHASTYGVGVVYGDMSDPYSASFVGAIRVL